MIIGEKQLKKNIFTDIRSESKVLPINVLGVCLVLCDEFTYLI